MLTERWYQMQGMKSVWPMPESWLSGQKGTVIFCERPLESFQPRWSPVLLMSSSQVHWPLRFTQSARSNCGRGYSGRGILMARADAKAAAAIVATSSTRLIAFLIMSLYYG